MYGDLMARVSVCSHLALPILLLKTLTLNNPLSSSAYNNGGAYTVWKMEDLTYAK